MLVIRMANTQEGPAKALATTLPKATTIKWDTPNWEEHLPEGSDSITVVAHTTDERETIGEKTPDQFVTDFIAQLQGMGKERIKNLYLISCEAGFHDQGQESIADKIQNKLQRNGYDITVHAFQNQDRNAHSMYVKIIEQVGIAGKRQGNGAAPGTLEVYEYLNRESANIDKQINNAIELKSRYQRNSEEYKTITSRLQELNKEKNAMVTNQSYQVNKSVVITNYPNNMGMATPATYKQFLKNNASLQKKQDNTLLLINGSTETIKGLLSKYLAPTKFSQRAKETLFNTKKEKKQHAETLQSIILRMSNDGKGTNDAKKHIDEGKSNQSIYTTNGAKKTRYPEILDKTTQELEYIQCLSSQLDRFKKEQRELINDYLSIDSEADQDAKTAKEHMRDWLLQDLDDQDDQSSNYNDLSDPLKTRISIYSEAIKKIETEYKAHPNEDSKIKLQDIYEYAEAELKRFIQTASSNTDDGGMQKAEDRLKERITTKLRSEQGFFKSDSLIDNLIAKLLLFFNKHNCFLDTTKKYKQALNMAKAIGGEELNNTMSVFENVNRP